MAVQPQKSIDLIWPELTSRFYAPCKSVTFYSYLVFGVIICGGSGVLTVFLKSEWSMSDVSAALLGYFPALFGAAVLEFTTEHQQWLRSLGLIGLCVLLAVAFIAVKTEEGWQLFWALTGTVLGILFWWVANGLNTRFDDVQPQSALGGDPSGTLQQSSDKEWRK
ncbi:MAG TPA: hypothetical protein VKD23_00030 [Terriglobales bacterium]|nr:hypothetical protein [Terriglobales bacterium]